MAMQRLQHNHGGSLVAVAGVEVARGTRIMVGASVEVVEGATRAIGSWPHQHLHRLSRSQSGRFRHHKRELYLIVLVGEGSASLLLKFHEIIGNGCSTRRSCTELLVHLKECMDAVQRAQDGRVRLWVANVATGQEAVVLRRIVDCLRRGHARLQVLIPRTAYSVLVVVALHSQMGKRETYTSATEMFSGAAASWSYLAGHEVDGLVDLLHQGEHVPAEDHGLQPQRRVRDRQRQKITR